MTTKTEDTPLNLEARLIRLELIVGALERDDLELEEALRLFEEGIEHIRVTRQILTESELQIEKLLDDGDGGPLPKPESATTEG